MTTFEKIREFDFSFNPECNYNGYDFDMSDVNDCIYSSGLINLMKNNYENKWAIEVLDAGLYGHNTDKEYHHVYVKSLDNTFTILFDVQ